MVGSSQMVSMAVALSLLSPTEYVCAVLILVGGGMAPSGGCSLRGFQSGGRSPGRTGVLVQDITGLTFIGILAKQGWVLAKGEVVQ